MGKTLGKIIVFSPQPMPASPPSRIPHLHEALLILLAMLLRLPGLGHRAMSHDESLHSLYSWYLYSHFRYQHDPMMHGPFLFHLNALLYTLFGANDFTARLGPALAGTACVAFVALAFPRWLGKNGALIAAALIAISPGLLYYSRYIRNDIYIAFFTLLMVWAALRHRDSGNPKYLLWLALGLALSFSTKALAYIHGTVLGAAAVLFTLIGWRMNHSLNGRERRWGNVAVTLLSLALPLASALLISWRGADPLDSHNPVLQRLTLITALSLSALSWLMASVWFTERQSWTAWMKSFALFWSVIILLYSTLLRNIPQGLTSGVASSLGYWLAQHEVRRGASDPLFYLSLLLLYTPVLLLTCGLSLKKINDQPSLLFLLWAFGNFLIYSMAGERMPWLVIHITLPLALLAGPVTARVFAKKSRWRFVMLPMLLHLVINSLRTAGPLAESPQEPLFYAHAGPQVKSALKILKTEHARTPDLPIHIDPDYTWPLAWYLRKHPVSYSPLPVPEARIRITSPNRLEAYTGQGWISRGEFDLIHWPRQHWHELTLSNVQHLAASPRIRQKFLRFYLFRQLPPLTPYGFPQPVRFILLTRDPP